MVLSAFDHSSMIENGFQGQSTSVFFLFKGCPNGHFWPMGKWGS